MAELKLTLITGRSTIQGVGVSRGKESADYMDETSVISLNRMDMERANLSDGECVRLRTEFGVADVKCRCADIPEGLAFMAFGSVCNQLVGDETCASGMPDSKNISIEIFSQAKTAARKEKL